MLVGSSPYHSAAYYHSSSALAGTLYETRKNTVQYLNLPSVNEELANDNAKLRELLSKSLVPIKVSTPVDSSLIRQQPIPYNFLAAKVINKSVSFQHNYITINKGSDHGIVKGMGVISSKGVVGKVISASKNFSTISSLLNVDVYVSSVIKRNNTFCSVKWDGRDPLKTRLLYVPRHIELQKGDSIVTSGYNTIFPENILIGQINEFSIEENATFYNIDVNLSNDFYKLSYVYVIKNPVQEEIQDLESKNIKDIE